MFSVESPKAMVLTFSLPWGAILGPRTHRRPSALDKSLESQEKHFRLDPAEICYLRFILEACDGMAVLRTIDPKTGLVSVSVAPGREEEAAGVLEDLSREIFLDPIPAP